MTRPSVQDELDLRVLQQIYVRELTTGVQD